MDQDDLTAWLEERRQEDGWDFAVVSAEEFARDTIPATSGEPAPRAAELLEQEQRRLDNMPWLTFAQMVTVVQREEHGRGLHRRARSAICPECTPPVELDLSMELAHLTHVVPPLRDCSDTECTVDGETND